jgi:hypothetical protein
MTTIAFDEEYAGLIRHAEKFGTECVFETACGYSDWKGGKPFEWDRGNPRLVRLRLELDAIDAERKVGLRGLGRSPRRRRSSGETAGAVRQLKAEGLVVSAIADKLGVSDAYVKRCCTAENGAANPHGYAAKSALSGKDGLAPGRGTEMALKGGSAMSEEDRAGWEARNNSPSKMLARGTRLIPGWKGVGHQAVQLSRGELDYLNSRLAGE